MTGTHQATTSASTAPQVADTHTQALQWTTASDVVDRKKKRKRLNLGPWGDLLDSSSTTSLNTQNQTGTALPPVFLFKHSCCELCSVGKNAVRHGRTISVEVRAGQWVTLRVGCTDIRTGGWVGLHARMISPVTSVGLLGYN